MFWGLIYALGLGLIFALVFRLVQGPLKRSAANSRLTLVWPSTRRQLLDFLRRAGRGLGLGLVVGLVFGLVMGLLGGVGIGLASGLVEGLVLGLIFGLVMGLGSGLLEPRSVLVTARTPREASSRSLIAALTWLTLGLGLGLVVGLGSVAWGLAERPKQALVLVLGFGLGLGLVLALRNGGWFVLLQRVARRRLARAGNLPPGPYDFLEWGIEKQIFRRVGGGIRFRHNLIQQQLAKSHQQLREAEARSELRGPVLAFAGVFLALAVLDPVALGPGWAFVDLLRFALIILAASGVGYLYLTRRQGITFREALLNWPRRPKLGLAGVFLALAVLDTAWGLWGTNPTDDFAYSLAVGIGMAIRDLLRFALIILVVSGAGFLLLTRHQEVTFRETIFNWPMVAVAGVVALLLLLTALIFSAFGVTYAAR